MYIMYKCTLLQLTTLQLQARRRGRGYGDHYSHYIIVTSIVTIVVTWSYILFHIDLCSHTHIQGRHATKSLHSPH